MARPTTPMKQTRTRHSQAYGWRSKNQQSQTSSEREQSVADENTRLKRLLVEQAEELAIVKSMVTPFFAMLSNDGFWLS